MTPVNPSLLTLGVQEPERKIIGYQPVVTSSLANEDAVSFDLSHIHLLLVIFGFFKNNYGESENA